MRKLVCSECGGSLGIQFEKGDPSYVDTEEIDTVIVSVDGETVFETDVNDLKELISYCPYCGAEVKK